MRVLNHISKKTCGLIEALLLRLTMRQYARYSIKLGLPRLHGLRVFKPRRLLSV